MPRKARLSPPGTFHHIMSRGIEGRDIFRDDADRRTFLGMLDAGLKKTGFLCYAWALMDNHYHLLVRTNEKHLSELMRRLNAGYAQYFSRKYRRRGYLFQDRYRSQVTQDQGYVERLVRYIHLNPIRTGLCRSIAALNRYRWTGHAALRGTARAEFQEIKPVLRRFGQTIESGRKGYEAFMSEGLSSPGSGDKIFQSTSDRRRPGSYVIGDPDFVKKAFTADDASRAGIARHLLEGVSIDDVAEKVAGAAHLTVKDIVRRSRGNRRSDIRRIFAYVCRHDYGMPITAIARYLAIAHSPASLAVRRGGELAGDKQFAKVLKALRP
ncbi:MAG: transposase [Chitinispirillaceae bacterium]|nr:transposase [Chitinispirillaceae bacterium]